MALRQREAETAAEPSATVAPPEQGARRFYGVVSLDPERLNRDFGRVTQEVVQHLTGLLGTEVEVTVEVRAVAPEGFPARVVRTVGENARTLRFASHGFEES